jgi:hypothetical protein
MPTMSKPNAAAICWSFFSSMSAYAPEATRPLSSASNHSSAIDLFVLTFENALPK